LLGKYHVINMTNVPNGKASKITDQTNAMVGLCLSIRERHCHRRPITSANQSRALVIVVVGATANHEVRRVIDIVVDILGDKMEICHGSSSEEGGGENGEAHFEDCVGMCVFEERIDAD
jgi:hypothetical protein